MEAQPVWGWDRGEGEKWEGGKEGRRKRGREGERERNRGWQQGPGPLGPDWLHLPSYPAFPKGAAVVWGLDVWTHP